MILSNLLMIENSKIRIVFFASGGGGNMKFIHLLSSATNIEIVGCIADRECGATKYANSTNIPTVNHSFKRTTAEDNKLIELITKFSPNIIVTNVHKVISHRVLRYSRAKFINIHYSYLPAYQGMIGLEPLRLAESRGNLFAGVTCHEVSQLVDDGNSLAQGFFPLSNDEITNNQLCFEAGALCLLSAILSFDGENRKDIMKYNATVCSPGIDPRLSSIIPNAFNRLKSTL